MVFCGRRHLEVAGAVDSGPFYPRCRLGGHELAQLLASLRATPAAGGPLG
jgi:hypothetical protein